MLQGGFWRRMRRGINCNLYNGQQWLLLRFCIIVCMIGSQEKIRVVVFWSSRFCTVKG
jgi:hypothetical protein